MRNPHKNDYCDYGAAESARLVVVIDTEEEFDWSGGFFRENTTVVAMQSIGRIQAIFNEYGIKPVYVVDYPVASQPDGYEALKEFHDNGECIIGAHLHPWVNPPFDEETTVRNSFPGNLPKSLETSKLQNLRDCIESTFGHRPNIYKAGRYGVGPNTEAILEQLGFEIDVSVRSLADFSDIDGPDFSEDGSRPYWFGTKKNLLELPLSATYVGGLRHYGSSLSPLLVRQPFRSLRARWLLRRLRLLEKLTLSPEGQTLQEMKNSVKALHHDGLRVFGLAFHSPSLAPGYTPYVRSNDDLVRFLDRCKGFFDWFLGDYGGVASHPSEIFADLVAKKPGANEG